MYIRRLVTDHALVSGLRLFPDGFLLDSLWLHDWELWEVLPVLKKKLDCLYQNGYEARERDIVRFLQRFNKYSLRYFLHHVIIHHPYPIPFNSSTLVARSIKNVLRGEQDRRCKVTSENIGLLLILHRWDAKASFGGPIADAVKGTPYDRLLSLHVREMDSIKSVPGLKSGSDTDGKTCDNTRDATTRDRCRVLIKSLWSDSDGDPSSSDDSDKLYYF